MGPAGVFSLALCLGLVSIHCTSSPRDIQVIDNLDDLKNKANFEEFLSILCWLLSLGEIDNNGKLHLNIDPADEPLGIHLFKNFEQTFPIVTNTNFRYYSFGNINKALRSLGKFKIYKAWISPRVNLYRVVIKIDKRRPTVVDKLYVTQHYTDMTEGSGYDLQFTFEISTRLLAEIKDLCLSVQKQQEFQRTRIKYKNYPQMYWALYQVERNGDNNAEANAEKKSESTFQSRNTNLQLKLTADGQARIVWDGIPEEMLSKEMKIGVYRGEDEDDPLVAYALNGRASGEIDTDLALSRGLQLRLLEPVTSYESVYESPEFDGSDVKAPEGTSYTLTVAFGLLVIFTVIATVSKMSSDNRPRATPHFVTVSHGRPGF